MKFSLFKSTEKCTENVIERLIITLLAINPTWTDVERVSIYWSQTIFVRKLDHDSKINHYVAWNFWICIPEKIKEILNTYNLLIMHKLINGILEPFRSLFLKNLINYLNIIWKAENSC